MTPVQRPTKTFWATWLPVILPVVTFFGGLEISYINQANKVEQLTIAVNRLTEKFDQQDDKNSKLDHRLTYLEACVFGKGSNTPINYSPVR